MKGICLVLVAFVIFFVGCVSAARCDVATTAQVQEGNLGQSGDFNWLGILHVHQYEEGKIRVAMTGIVLIKLKHALANADDVVKIPMKIFKSESKAMFMPARDTPWEVKPASYVTHPEYEYATLNTIAVIELDLDDVDDYPLNPICLPSGETFNTSRYLYLTGFTDGLRVEVISSNDLSRPVLVQREKLSSQKRTPTVYVCGYAPSNKTQCVWDSGMVLVSNVTGYFNLIGFGVHGPGCAAPARFVDLFPYFSWINSIITPDEVYDEASFRRKDDGDEFSPAHEHIRMNDSLHTSDVIHPDFTQNPLVKGNIDHNITKVAEDEKPILPSNSSRISRATVTT